MQKRKLDPKSSPFCPARDSGCGENRRMTPGPFLAAFLFLALGVSLSARGAEENWPAFRGVQASGVTEGHATATRWNVEEGKNILWKIPIPGLGHSCPVIWGNRLFVTTAANAGGEAELKVGRYGSVEPVEETGEFSWRVICLDKATGKVLWKHEAHKGKPKIKRHPKSSHANATPVTDGKHVVVFFGSEGLFCYDPEGKLLWKKDLGTLDWGWFRSPAAQWEGGSSPVIHDGTVILQCDVQKGSFLAAFDLKDGSERWKTARNDVPTWGTPTLCTVEGKAQVIVNGFRHIGAYDAATGKEIWKMHGGGDIPVPTPVLGHGLVFITNAHGGMSPIYAIRTSAKGDITLADGATSNDFVAWSIRRGGNYMTTPIVLGEYLYLCSDGGRLTCWKAKSGEMIYRERLGPRSGAFTASPVAADGKIYFPGERGHVFVVKAGPAFEVLAKNEMGETCMATPAISKGVLFFRTRAHLVAVAKKP
ncbi:MAG: PQQ-binding-like beta-propeller repeat protein [Planctomycetota bacterium]|jgi:outer membrane protein assembly factor BamB